MSATVARWFFHGMTRAWDGWTLPIFVAPRPISIEDVDSALRRDWQAIGAGLYAAMAQVRAEHPEIDWPGVLASASDPDCLPANQGTEQVASAR